MTHQRATTSTRFRILLALVGLASVLLTACGGSEEASSGIRVVPATEAADTLAADPDMAIIDVRTPEEFEAGHIEGAVLIDIQQADFADRLAELDPDLPYLLYCRSGNRSAQAREVMADLNFTNVTDVEGGILAWEEAGLPVVQ